MDEIDNTYTLNGNSDVCDYWIVGDQSTEAKEHPKKTDEKGYWNND